MVIARIHRAEGVGNPMSGKIQTRLALLAALAALVAVVVPATLAFGSHDGGITNPGSPEYVFLKLGNTDAVVFGDQTETITGKNNCTATTFAGPDLLNLSAVGGSVGFVKDGFGVRSSGDGNGEPCGRVEADDGEVLSVTLGSAISDYLMTAVDLDLELKFNASVDIFFKHDGNVVAEVQDFTGMGGSDDGPDSGDLDNFRFNSRMYGVNTETDTVFFNEIVIDPDAGAVSLEGGADGTEAGELVTTNNWSQFEVVKGFDGDINCGDTDPLFEEGVSTSGNVTMHSEDLGEGWLLEPNCELKPYNFWLENDALAFVPELADSSARYTIEITVEDQQITVDGNGQITSLVAVYDPAPELTFPDGADESALKACLDQPILDMGDDGYDAFWQQDDADGVGLLPAGESACWYHASVESTGSGVGTEFWGIYFEDDPGFSFR
jgi:hypothetical protein